VEGFKDMGEGEGSEGRGIEQAQGEKEMPSERSAIRRRAQGIECMDTAKSFSYLISEKGGG